MYSDSAGEAAKNQEAGYCGYCGWEALVITRLLVTRTLVSVVIVASRGFC